MLSGNHSGSPPATVPQCFSGLVQMGYWCTETSPVVGVGVAGQDIVWAPPPAIMSLCSFMVVQMRFCQVTNREIPSSAWNVVQRASSSKRQRGLHLVAVQHRSMLNMKNIELHYIFPEDCGKKIKK